MTELVEIVQAKTVPSDAVSESIFARTKLSRNGASIIISNKVFLAVVKTIIDYPSGSNNIIPSYVTRKHAF